MTKNEIIQILFFYKFIYLFINFIHHCIVSGDSVKNKWRNLRDCYIKYKRLEKGTTGTAACTKYKKWPWGSHLQFLDDSLVRPSTKSNVPSQNPTSETGAMEASPPNIPAPSGSSVSVTQAHQLPSSQMPPPQKRMRNSKEQSDDVQQLIKYFHSKNTSKRQPDEIDHLFMSYAATFKRFSSRRQTKLKMELANLFGKAELEEMDESYSNSSCSTRRCSLDSDHRSYSDYNSNDSNAMICAYSQYQSTSAATEQPEYTEVLQPQEADPPATLMTGNHYTAREVYEDGTNYFAQQ